MLGSILPEGAGSLRGFLKLFAFVIASIFLYAGVRSLVMRLAGVNLPATA